MNNALNLTFNPFLSSGKSFANNRDFLEEPNFEEADWRQTPLNGDYSKEENKCMKGRWVGTIKHGSRNFIKTDKKIINLQGCLWRLGIHCSQKGNSSNTTDKYGRPNQEIGHFGIKPQQFDKQKERGSKLLVKENESWSIDASGNIAHSRCSKPFCPHGERKNKSQWALERIIFWRVFKLKILNPLLNLPPIVGVDFHDRDL